MSVSTLYNGRNYINQPIIKSDTLLNTKTTFTFNDHSISSYIDANGHHFQNDKTGTKLLSFSHNDTLNDSVLKQHITDHIYNSQLGQIPISTILRFNNNAQQLNIQNLNSVQSRDFVLSETTTSIKDTIDTHNNRLSTLENMNGVQLNATYAQQIATLQAQNTQLINYVNSLKSFFSVLNKSIQLHNQNGIFDFSNLE